MSDSEAVFGAIQELIGKHTSDEGIDLVAIQEEMLETLLGMTDVDVELLESMKVGVTNQAIMFCALLDAAIEKMTKEIPEVDTAEDVVE